MSNIFQCSCLGELTAFLVKKTNSEYGLVWYVHVDFSPKQDHMDSVLIEHIPLSPRNWLSLEGKEYIGNEEASFYSGCEGVHYFTSYVSLKFLKREKDTFHIQINSKFAENIHLPYKKLKEISELNFQAEVVFKGIKILERDSGISYVNFTNSEYMRNFMAKYISLEYLSGPFYPFPPTEPYSKTSWAFFTPSTERVMLAK